MQIDDQMTIAEFKQAFPIPNIQDKIRHIEDFSEEEEELLEELFQDA